ncbi:MAG: LytTR family DNA-binding domain-containing protein [Clostridia bacterium]|nr:LytTR family DNA-binding domain-containing protein [Clostridia bacterium]
MELKENYILKIGMCDDELGSIKSFSSMLESAIEKQDLNAKISLITTNQKEMFDAVFNKEIDILFLDVDFKNNGKNGIEFAEDLRNVNKEFFLVFLSAHQRYMHVSFFVKVYDYIVKPANKDVVEHLIKRLKGEFDYNNKLFLHLNKWITVRIDDILYIEKLGNKCNIITTYNTQSTTKSLETLLNELPNYFRKCHRSYIVNERKILTLDKKEKYAFFPRGIKCPINSYFDL